MDIKQARFNMIEQQIRPWEVLDGEVLALLSTVKREHFVPAGLQALAFVDMGFALGFGGTLSYERSLQLRRLACDLPLSALVLETDAPDIPPHWLYVTAEDRAQGLPQGRNTPDQIPRIAQALADLRGISLDEVQQATTANVQAVLGLR